MNRYAFGHQAGLNAGTISAIGINFSTRELMVWMDGTEQPNCTATDFRHVVFVRTLVAAEYGKYKIVAVSLVAHPNATHPITQPMIAEAIAAAQALIADKQFAGVSAENGRVVTAMNYGGTIEMTPEIVDFAFIGGNAAPQIFTLGREKTKVYNLATNQWQGVQIEGTLDLAQVRGITRIVPCGKSDRYMSLISLGTGGEMIAVEFTVRGEHVVMRALPGVIRLTEFKEVVGPVVGNHAMIGGFNKAGLVITVDRTDFATMLERAGAPARHITAYAQPGYGV